jgi:hypothetical protein
MLDFNTEPYNDDYDETKKFYRILYRPSFAVQARELSQMQSILQNQIKRHGDAVFKQGTMVIPGQASVQTVTQPNKGADYVKLQSLYEGVAVETFLSQLLGKTLVGQTSGVKATVQYCQSAENNDPTTVYLNYLSSGTNTTSKLFSPDEILITEDDVYSVQVESDAESVGKGSLATINQGVYYIDGHFCLVDTQTIVLDKYTTAPTYRIGLTVSEEIITPEEDETLLDNAQNSFNYAAPGAHRYYIDLTLTKLSINSTSDANFVELIRVTNGAIKTIVDKTEYSLLGDELARRTFDESGDYTVNGFGIDVREHRNNNRGVWTSNTAFLIGDIVSYGGYTYVALNSATSITTPPTHTSASAYDGPGATGVNWQFDAAPVYNRGINMDGDESKLAIGIESGKAYVRGYEVEKTAITYVPVPKARDFIQATASVVDTTVGNYVLVTNVNNSPPVDSLAQITLYDSITGSGNRGSPQGVIVGYARARFIEWHNGLPFGYSAIYKLGLFDVQMSPGYAFNTDVKGFAYTVPSDPNLNFTADISPVVRQLIGSVTASSTTIAGTGTSFLTDLRVGDLVAITSASTTAFRKVTAVTNQNSITVDATITVTGATIAKCTTEILEPQKQSLIFPLAYQAIRSMRTAGSGGTNNTTFYTQQKFTQTATGTALTLSTSGTFAPTAEPTNYLVIDNGSDAPGGTIITPVSISPSGSTCSITLPSAQSGRSITVIATVIRNGSGFEKTKSLTNAVESFTTAVDAQANVIYLDKADLFKIVSITMAPGVAFGSTPTTGQYTVDITDRYEIDNGQRSTHYDWASLTLKPSYAAPSNPIRVTYQYFEHGAGDYFNVNSYSGIDYKQIPGDLRDSLDFRSRVANKSGGAKNFIGTGGIISGVPKRGQAATADYSYYLPRRDKIAIDFNGLIFDIAGISSLTPGYPADPALGMVLYTLDLNAYTYDSSQTNVIAAKIDNKRYTMRDIGILDKRINTLEYYTALSMLEQETNSLSIKDSTGLERTKNGFVVDNFAGNNLGNARSADYFCAIDMKENTLRPFYTVYNANLLEKYSNDSARAGANYKLTGDIITLPYTTTPIVRQVYASRTENINPFAIFTFLGNVQLNPPTDDWFETARMPDIIQQVEGNYTTIQALSEKAGVLGTVWGAWTTQWIGDPVRTGGGTFRADRRGGDGGAWLDATFGIGPEAAGWAARTVTADIFATPVGQSRTGVNTKLELKTDYEQVDDRTVSTTVIPYIRSRNILVQAHKLKPSTRFYPYFDGVDVSTYCTAAQKLVYTPSSGTFNYKVNVGGQGSAAARRIDGDSEVCLNTGDVITNSAGTATAVVVNVYIDENDAYCLSVVNVKGTFANGQTISGSNSSAQGTVVSITPQSTLVTNSAGELEFLFNIPQTDAIRFRTGTREFKLVDVSTYNGDYTSRGITNYVADGTLITKQATVNAVRNAILVQEEVSDNQTIYNTSTRVTSDTGWYDPLAQSFLIEQKGGAFLTSIDIFFATKDDNVPVTLQVREMVNGTPGKTILPFSIVTKRPEEVNLSANFVTMPDGTQKRSYDTPTTFTFESPVYVQDKTEYCFVLQSDSNNYNVWISYMGDVIPGSGRTISEQPYAGVMFLSQNASTWTADNNADIKFTINRAVFNTSVVGDIEFVNDVVPYDTLDTDPFQTTSGSTTVRVWHYDHGMPTGSTVDISAVNCNDLGTGTITASTSSTTVTGVGTAFSTQLAVGAALYNSADVLIGSVASIASNTSLTLASNAGVAVAAGSTFQYVAPINGIPAIEMFTTKIIGNVDPDSYTVSVSTAATTSGYTGGTFVKASRNIQYDIITPTVQIQTFSDTATTFNIKTTSGKSVDGSQSPYVADAGFSPALNKENNYFFTPRMIASEVNENLSLAGSKSVTFSAQMQTNNDSVSPVIDTTRTSLIAISNKLNNPSETLYNVAALDNITAFTHATGAFTFTSGGTITSTVSGVRTAMAGIGIGKFVTISGATSSGNNATFLVTGFSDDGTTGTLTLSTTFTGENSVSGTTITARTLFASEIAPVGSTSQSKYVTTPVKFAFASTYLRVMMAANIPAEADVSVYYKTCTGDSAQLDNTKYTLMTSDGVVTKVDNGNPTFSDLTYTLTDMPSFDTIVIKIVMNSTNTSAPPIIKDFRIIACP